MNVGVVSFPSSFCCSSWVKMTSSSVALGVAGISDDGAFSLSVVEGDSRASPARLPSGPIGIGVLSLTSRELWVL